MKSIFLKSFSNQLHTYDLSHDDSSNFSLESIKQIIMETWGIPVQEQALYHNGRLIHNITGLENLGSGSVIDVNLRLQGGKGGFGSLLRGQAISKRKITNFDASRDLQGRRIRDVKNKQKIMEWAKKRREEEKIIKKEVDEFKKAQKEIQSTQKDIRLAQEFKDKNEKWDNEMSHSIRAGAQKAKKPVNKAKEEGFELDDFEEPRRKKKVCTETLKETTITERLNGDGDVLDVKITQKLATILSEEGPKDQTEVVQDGKKESEQTKEERNAETQANNGGTEKKESSKEFAAIDLNSINSLEDLIGLGPDHVKHELMRLGLKCGGSLQERAKRLWDIKCKPDLLFHPKYIAKK